jgi:hypothetical protein
VSDKSPRSTASKKSGKSLKEKRADKRSKHDPAPSVIPTTTRGGR